MRTRFAIFGSGSARLGHKWPTFERRGFGKGDVGHFAGQTFEREFFSQRKERIAVPHQDAAQIRMTVKLDPHHVVDLPLVPIRGRPNV